jgi:hypothetical protein
MNDEYNCYIGGTMNTKNVKILVIVSLLLLLLVSCSHSSFPTGTFTYESENWTLILSDDGSYTFLENGTVEASGTYSIQENTITWETDSYCDKQKAGKATYTWSFKNETLFFTVNGEDKCTDRQSVLDNIPYSKKP